MPPTSATSKEARPPAAPARGNARGLLPFVRIAANLTFWIVPLLAVALGKAAVPLPFVRRVAERLMTGIYHRAVDADDRVLFDRLGLELAVEGLEAAYPEPFYLLVANHRSWSDILILQHLFNRRAPLLKFLVKRELIFVPLVGLICWAYDYPFLRRGRAAGGGADRDRLDRALQGFRRSSATVVNFVEGTRFADAKARTSPYGRLLPPKAGGLAWILQALGHRLTWLLDVTLVYPDGPATFWDLLCGRLKRVSVHVRRLSVDEAFGPQARAQGPAQRQGVQSGINRLWRVKDERLARVAGVTDGDGDEVQTGALEGSDRR